MKKTLALMLALTLAFSFSVFGSALAAVSEEQYLEEYEEYVSFYENAYVPAYNAYNAALNGLAEWINENSNILTATQFYDIIEFLHDLKARRSEFFGDRTTPGKSRYEVPLYRNAMFEAAESEDYILALQNRDILMEKVEERITFLSGLMNDISNYVLPTPPSPVTDVTAELNVTSETGYGFYEFEVIITNNSDQDISNWKLSFDYDGGINSMWFADGSANVFASSGNHYTIKTTNNWQKAYTIPAGGSITILGNGHDCGSYISYATINKDPIFMTFNR